MSKSTSSKKIETMNETVMVAKKVPAKKVSDSDGEATVPKKSAKKVPDIDDEATVPKKSAKKVPDTDDEATVPKKSAKKDTEEEATVPKKLAKKVPDAEATLPKKVTAKKVPDIEATVPNKVPDVEATLPKKVPAKKAPAKNEKVATNKVTAQNDINVTHENMTEYHVLLEKWVNFQTEIQNLHNMIEPLEQKRDLVVTDLRKLMYSAKMPEAENVENTIEDNVDPIKKFINNVPNEKQSGVKMPEAFKKVVSTSCKKKTNSNQKLEENSEESEIILPKVAIDSDSSQSDLETLSSCSSESESDCSVDDVD